MYTQKREENLRVFYTRAFSQRCINETSQNKVELMNINWYYWIDHTLKQDKTIE